MGALAFLARAAVVLLLVCICWVAAGAITATLLHAQGTIARGLLTLVFLAACWAVYQYECKTNPTW